MTPTPANTSTAVRDGVASLIEDLDERPSDAEVWRLREAAHRAVRAYRLEQQQLHARTPPDGPSGLIVAVLALSVLSMLLQPVLG